MAKGGGNGWKWHVSAPAGAGSALFRPPPLPPPAPPPPPRGTSRSYHEDLAATTTELCAVELCCCSGSDSVELCLNRDYCAELLSFQANVGANLSVPTQEYAETADGFFEQTDSGRFKTD